MSSKYLKLSNTAENYYVPILDFDEDNQPILVDNDMMAIILKATLEKVYPKGSLYWTDNVEDDPNSHLPGKWERIKDKFVFSADAESTYQGGGNSCVTLAANQLPSHCHYLCVENFGTNTTYWYYTSTATPLNEKVWLPDGGGDVFYYTPVENCYELCPVSLMTDRLSAYLAPHQEYIITCQKITSNYFFSTCDCWIRTMSAFPSTVNSFNISTSNTGASCPINIMPPYVSYYAWRRVE